MRKRSGENFEKNRLGEGEGEKTERKEEGNVSRRGSEKMRRQKEVTEEKKTEGMS